MGYLKEAKKEQQEQMTDYDISVCVKNAKANGKNISYDLVLVYETNKGTKTVSKSGFITAFVKYMGKSALQKEVNQMFDGKPDVGCVFNSEAYYTDKRAPYVYLGSKKAYL